MFVLLIMNCLKYKDKAEKQKAGWIRELPSQLPYFHVIGNEDLDTPYQFDHTEHILYVRTKDDYNSLPHKVISAYEAVNSEYQYEYIFKTDDDQNLTQPAFLPMLMEFLKANPQANYGGKIVNVLQEHISEYYHFHPELPRDVLVKKTQYCNGRFYFLSKRSVLDLLGKKAVFKKEFFEDYTVGYYLDPLLKNPISEIPNDVFVDF